MAYLIDDFVEGPFPFAGRIVGDDRLAAPVSQPGAQHIAPACSLLTLAVLGA